MKVCLPGSYDPPTLGHLDVIRRAAEQYGEVYAVVFVNPDKKARFSPEERVRMLTLATEKFDNVLVSYSDGLVIDYCHDSGIEKIVKGVRNEKDVRYEDPQAAWNLTHGGIPTEYITANPAFAGISSTLARAALDAGEPLDGILPQEVVSYLRQRHLTK